MRSAVEILFLDDDETTLFIHKKVFEKCGYPHALKTFTSGTECLQYMTENPNKVGHFVLLIDINMPGMNGWEVLDALRGLESSIAFTAILATSSIDPSDKERARGYEEVIGVIDKPMTVSSCERIFNMPGLKRILVDG